MKKVIELLELLKHDQAFCKVIEWLVKEHSITSYVESDCDDDEQPIVDLCVHYESVCKSMEVFSLDQFTVYRLYTEDVEQNAVFRLCKNDPGSPYNIWMW